MPEEQFGDVQEIKPFEVYDEEFSFPTGKYLFAFGGISAVYAEGVDASKEAPDAVLNELWVLKYLGEDGNPKSEPRTEIRDGKAIFVKDSTRGVKLVERYPNPLKMPKMAWRARAFFSKFEGCIQELSMSGFDGQGNIKTKKVIDWGKVRTKYGSLFTANILYSKAKNGRSYRNIDYETVLPIQATVVPHEDMRKFEELYKQLKDMEKAAQTADVKAPEKIDDLPF